MRRWLVLALQMLVAIASLALLSACGGKSAPKTTGPGVPASVTLAPTSASVTRGQTLQFSAAVLDSTSNAVTSATITFTSSNTSVLQVASGGLGCAGTWDSLTNPVVCTAGPIGTATVTAVSGSLSSTPATVSVHERVDTVTVTPTNATCISSGHTLQFTAHAFSGGKDVTTSVGSFLWNTTQTQVASIDTTGIATAAAPGVGGIYASINGVNSTPVPFSSCPVLSIALHTDQGQTSFALDSGTTQTLQADVIDVTGVPLVNASTYLTVIPLNQAVGTVAGGLTFTQSSPGTTPILATCAPPTCNIGLAPVYSNVVMGKVNGSTATTVYVASPSSTSLVPIDTTKNTAGTAITLPYYPNSLVLSSDGLKAYMGSDLGVMFLDLNASTVSTLTSVLGRVLAIQPDGTKIVVANSVKGTVYVVSTASGATETFNAPGVLAAAFSPDGYKAFFVTGDKFFYTYSPTVAFRTDQLSAPAFDAGFLNSGTLGFLAGGAPSSVTARFTCNGQAASATFVPTIPSRLQSLPNGSGMLAVDNAGVDILSTSLTTVNTFCPPAASVVLTKSASFNSGVLAPHQLLITPDGTQAFVLADQAKVLGYSVGSNTTFTIPLTGGALPTTGGITLDSAQLWVGGSDKNVHLIDVKSGKDIAQVPVSFSPDLVAVRAH